ncbi:MAG: RNase H-like domain-containing protein, partial [Cyanobacteria bacterium J06598_3]
MHKPKVKEDVTPVQQKMRPLPLAVREEVKTHLEELEAKGVIERVDSSPWISPMVVTRRRTGGIRVCLDLKEVNKAVSPSKHPIPDMTEMLDKLRGATVFSTLDMRSAFNQLELHPDSRNLTAFMSYDGLRRYTRCCFGLSSIPAAFQKVMEQVLTGLSGVQVYLDDLVIYGETAAQHDARLQQVLDRLQEHQVTLNDEKCTFSASSLDFLGFTVSSEGVSVSQDRVSGMRDIKSPTSQKELHSALGLFGFYARFVRGFSTLVDPLRAALKQDRFQWTDDLEKTFRQVVGLIIESSVLAMYDPELPTVVTTDASDVGLGAVLSQLHPEGERVVSFASATLSSAQRKYSVTEREALAARWAVEHWHRYLFGQHFTLRTDHQALQSLLTSKGIGRAGMRLSRWAVRLMVYNFTVEHVSGVKNAADGLSRLPASTMCATPDDEHLMVAAVTGRVEQKSAVTRTDLQAASAGDQALVQLRDQIAVGWPTRADACAPDTRPYYRFRHELSVVEDLVLRGERVIVPSSLRLHLVEQAHEGHQGIVRTKQRLRELFYWPGMDAAVETLVRNCAICDACDKSYKTRNVTLNPVPFPDKPWSKVGIDFIGPLEGGGVNRRFAVVLVDYYSKWPEVGFCSSPSSQAVVDFLESVTCREGFPEEVVTDNGTAFTSQEFADYLRVSGVKHIRVTPYHPRGAGAVERFNRVLKGALQSASTSGQDWIQFIRQFLRTYRTTPHATTGRSPSEL